MIRLVGIVVAVAVVVGGCSSSDADEPEPTRAAPSSAAPKPTTDAKAQALLAALRKVDPALADKPERTVSRARDVCLDIEQGKDAATVRKNARLRFSGGAVQLDQRQAAKVVRAVRTFCS